MRKKLILFTLLANLLPPTPPSEKKLKRRPLSTCQQLVRRQNRVPDSKNVLSIVFGLLKEEF